MKHCISPTLVISARTVQRRGLCVALVMLAPFLITGCGGGSEPPKPPVEVSIGFPGGPPTNHQDLARGACFTRDFSVAVENASQAPQASIIADADGDLSTTADQVVVWRAATIAAGATTSASLSARDSQTGESLSDGQHDLFVRVSVEGVVETISHPTPINVMNGTVPHENVSDGDDEMHDIAEIPGATGPLSTVVCGQFEGSISFPLAAGGLLTRNSVDGIDGFMARLDAEGNAEWFIRIGSAAQAQALFLDVSNDRIAVTGIYEGMIELESTNGASHSLSHEAGREGFWASYDFDGNVQWVASATGSGSQHPRHIELLANGNVLVVGSMEGRADLTGSAGTLNPPGSTTQRAGFMALYSDAGAFVWSEFIDSADNNDEAITETACGLQDGGFLVGGRFGGMASLGGAASGMNSLGGVDLWVARFDAAGTFQWMLREGGVGDEHGTHVELSNNGDGFVLFGGYREEVTLGQDLGGMTIMLPLTVDLDLFIAEYSLDRELERGRSWAHEAGDAQPRKVRPARDGGFLLAANWSGSLTVDIGSTTVELLTAGGIDGGVLHIDDAFDVLSAVQLGSTATDRVRSCIQRSDCTLRIVGGYSAVATFGAGLADPMAHLLPFLEGEELFLADVNPDGSF